MNGRTDLTCRTARDWLQATDGLSNPDAWSLTRHLEHCAECRDFHTTQRTLDAQIRRSLDEATAGQSVRAEVLRQIQSSSRRPRRSFPRLLPHAVSLAAAAVVALLLVVLVPQVLQRAGERTPGAIAWRVIRPEIGYPMTVDPRDPDHLLAGDAGQIYQSRDGGTSWHQLAPLPAGNIIRAVLIDRQDSGRYLVATMHSVFLSDDGGRHWTRTATSLPGAMNMFLLQGPDAKTFYVGPSILWKSVDGGHTWHPSGPGTVFAPDGIQALNVAPGGNLVTGIWAGGVAISRDGGVSWQRRTRGLARDVIDVAALDARTIWAATDRGVYRTTDGGASWHARGLTHLKITSLLVRPSFVLAGGTRGLYRSADGGKTWQTITAGLSPVPYVANFVGDAARPQRVYASLDDNGIFRSDDGGLTWTDASNGLKIVQNPGGTDTVLFLRGGSLWKTTSAGADPGVLTVDDTVRAADLSPDGVSAAYVTTEHHGWTAHVLSAGGGSLAHTIAQGTGTVPTRLLWSPTSTLLAMAGKGSVTVSDMHGIGWTWRVGPSEHLVGWAPSGRNLFFWDTGASRIGERTIHGTPLGERPGRYGGRPAIAPDYRHLAYVSGTRLWIGTWGKVRPVRLSDTSCVARSWSDDGRVLLLTCADTAQIRTVDGTLLHHIILPGTATWAPASHDLLFFKGGALWRWDGQGTRRLVSDAAPAGT